MIVNCVMALILLLLCVALAACTNGTVPSESTEFPSTTDGAIPFDSGIEGTLTRNGERSKSRWSREPG